jgi:predicted MFS family arabinose efflux permease
VHQTGAALGSWAAGALFEATGGYGLIYVLACTVLGAASVIALRIDDGQRPLRWLAARAG